ncbi:unnamed protein product [Symbiodinium microadriaticum]|nr:unnamed protein product [Symbiodinium sp. KB8]CAE7857282.1 unnamed protein product [Symbiodinium microadriaticum]
MDAASWLSSLVTQADDVETPEDQPEGQGDAAAQREAEAVPAAERALEELLSAGFPKARAEAALAASDGDLDEALAALARKPQDEEAVQCSLTEQGELVMLLPGDSLRPGPVVGRKKPDGGVLFDGMDDWLWELYEGHRPRPSSLPASFDTAAAVAALEDGAPYVWDDFATLDEIKEANSALEDMFQRRELTRGSSLWVDECAEGGHARNRRALEGQRRDDACGFWDVQGGEPAPPAPILRLFRRLEAAAARLREDQGWPLLCSRLGMGAVYDGQGACYEQHRDNEWQLHLRPKTPRGLAPADVTEAKRRRLDFDAAKGAWMNYRELTMLAYVNLPQDFGDHEAGRRLGGRLRCYVATKRGDLTGSTARELKELAPCGGRAVIFRSKELLHEVLPSFGRRYCLTFWVCTPHA